MKKRKISITSENGVKIAIESECTSEQVKKVNTLRLSLIANFEKDFDVNVFTRNETVTIEKTFDVVTSDKTVETFSKMEKIADEFFFMIDSCQLEKPKNTKEVSQDKRQEYVEFCKAILGEWNKFPRTGGAAIMCEFESKIVTVPVGWICGDLLKKLLQCYVERNS